MSITSGQTALASDINILAPVGSIFVSLKKTPITSYVDNFTRADSNTVGNGWTENTTGTAGAESISSNKLKLGDGSGNYGAGVGRNSIRTLPINFTAKFNINSNPSGRNMYFVAGLASNINGNDGVNFRVVTGTTNNIGITRDGTVEATGSYSVSNGTDYYVWVDIIANGSSNIDINCYINTTNSKPGSPNVSKTNVAKPSGNKLGVYIDATLGGVWYIDDLSYFSMPTLTDCLECNGNEVSRTTYADLFSVIGTDYGSGDGSTTFNVPSLTDTNGTYYIRYKVYS